MRNKVTSFFGSTTDFRRVDTTTGIGAGTSLGTCPCGWANEEFATISGRGLSHTIGDNARSLVGNAPRGMMAVGFIAISRLGL